MPRYELSEGTSNKFWQIDLKGASFTTTFGKIGSAGQTSLKDFGDAATAKKEYDKLVAEKTKKGYTLVGAAKVAKPPKAGPEAAKPPKAKAKAAAAAPAAASNVALEKAIDADPDGDDSWSVYADWLESQGDPRGQLAAVQLTLAKNPRDKAALAAEKKLIKDHADTLIGAGVAKYMVRDGKNEIAGITRKPDLGCDVRDDQEAAPVRVDWKAGFFKHAFVAHPGMDWTSGYGKKSQRGDDDDGDGDDDDGDGEGGDVDVGKLLASVLDSPSARFLASLTLGLPNSAEDGECMYDPVLKALVKHPTAARLRALSIGDIVDEDAMISSIDGDISKTVPKLTNLRELTVRGNGIKIGKLGLPELRHLTIICGGLRKADVADILGGKFPKLERLEISFGQQSYGADAKLKDLEPLLSGKVFKTVKYLGLCNCEFADELAGALGTSKILAQVTALDLSEGTLTEVGVKAMAEHAAAFAHLRKLDLSKNYLNGAAEKLATKICAVARTKPQRTPSEYGGESHRYAVLGE